MFLKLKQAKEVFLNLAGEIDYAIITGTGINIDINYDTKKRLEYAQIPNMPKPTTPSHKGFFEYIRMKSKKIVVANGRFHYYEDYSMYEVVFLARLLGMCGAKLVILTNAAGGLNPNFKKGDLMAANDHINMMGANPLKGKNIDELGEKFPDMSEPYNKKYMEKLKKTAVENKIELQEGVYIGVSGPSMETPAETRFFRMIGADAVGMSTVPEVIALRHMGIDCVSVSIITNLNKPDCMSKAPLDSVIKTAKNSSKKLSLLLNKFLEGVE